LIRPNAAALAELVMNVRQSNTMLIDEIRTRWFGLGPLPDGQGQIALAPLASNTAPSQTQQSAAPKAPAKPAPEPAKKAA
jgi:hypothetical protein